MASEPHRQHHDPDPRWESNPRIGQLIAHLQAELRQIAARELKRERPNHTLQPTALVNEAFLRLTEQQNLGDASRSVFLAAAAQTMQRILVESARARQTQKRGAHWVTVTLSGLDAATAGEQVEILDLNDAIQRLSQESERMAAVVVLRYFGGLTVQESAESLGVSPRTVADDWTFARAWLRRELASYARSDVGFPPAPANLGASVPPDDTANDNRRG